MCNNRAPALSASSVERSHQTRGKLLTELVARNQASNVCVRIYIYINIDRRRRESHVVLHLSIPNPFDPLIQRVDYMHSLYIYISTTFSYIARYKYKFIDISLREGERKRDEYRSTGLIESIRNDINGKRRYKLALVSFRSPLFAIIDSLPLQLARITNPLNKFSNLSIEREGGQRRNRVLRKERGAREARVALSLPSRAGWSHNYHNDAENVDISARLVNSAFIVKGERK